jgi:GT2 family glycosyltransferase
MSSKISIFMLVRNNLAYTKQCLHSIKKCTEYPNYELIIVNNHSTDGTERWLKDYEPGVKATLITNKENKSFSVGNNQASTIATGEYFLLLNNDIIVTPGWMTNMRKVFDEEEMVGAVGARLIRPGIGTLQHCGILKSMMNLPAHQFFDYPANIPEATTRGEYFAVTGACFMTPAKLYRKHLFNEIYVYGWEDIDYCNRLKKDNYRMIYEPSAIVYHYESKTPGRYDHDSANMGHYMKRWVQFNEA